MAVLEDRVSAKPGRMLVKPESGAEFYATLEMADEPVAPGNKLNRQNVIDTLLPMSENGGVGTVVWTAAQNVDDRWLECDGSEVLAAEHPELAEVLPAVPLTLAGVKTVKVAESASYSQAGASAVRYVEGYYFVQYGRDLYYTKSLSEEWQKIENLFYNYDYAELAEIVHAGGYWLIYVNDYKYAYVYYATSLDGTWASVNMGSTGPLVAALFYRNGMFYAMRVYNKFLNIYSGSTPSALTHKQTIEFAEIPRKIQYSNVRKRWELCAVGTACTISLYYSDNLLEWEQIGKTSEVLSQNVNGIYGQTVGLGIDEAYWNVTDIYTQKIYRMMADGSGVESVDIPNGSYSMRCLCDGQNELLVASNGAYYWYVRNSANEEFVAINPPLPNPTTRNIGYKNDEPLSCGGFAFPCDTNGTWYFFNSFYGKYRPEITVPDATGVTKAYIKAK